MGAGFTFWNKNVYWFKFLAFTDNYAKPTYFPKKNSSVRGAYALHRFDFIFMQSDLLCVQLFWLSASWTERSHSEQYKNNRKIFPNGKKLFMRNGNILSFNPL